MPIEDWYKESEISNKDYWPMDYPPICAYVHYLMGLVIKKIMPDAVSDGVLARGYMEKDYITVMRAFVVLLEYIVFVPGYLRLLSHFPSK